MAMHSDVSFGSSDGSLILFFVVGTDVAGHLPSIATWQTSLIIESPGSWWTYSNNSCPGVEFFKRWLNVMAWLVEWHVESFYQTQVIICVYDKSYTSYITHIIETSGLYSLMYDLRAARPYEDFSHHWACYCQHRWGSPLPIWIEGPGDHRVSF